MDVLAPSILAMIYFAVAAGAFTQGSIGLGLGIVAAPPITFLAPHLVPGPLIAMGFALSVLVVIREPRFINWREFMLATGSRIPAAILGGFCVGLLTERQFMLIFAVLFLLAVGVSALGWRATRTPRNLMIAGAASGFIGTITAVGAPPMAVIYQHGEGRHVRGTLGAYFLVGSATSLVALWMFTGTMRNDLIWSLWLLPAMAVGFALSGPARRYVDAGRLRPVLLSISAVAAVILLIRAII